MPPGRIRTGGQYWCTKIILLELLPAANAEAREADETTRQGQKTARLRSLYDRERHLIGAVKGRRERKELMVRSTLQGAARVRRERRSAKGLVPPPIFGIVTMTLTGLPESIHMPEVEGIHPDMVSVSATIAPALFTAHARQFQVLVSPPVMGVRMSVATRLA